MFGKRKMNFDDKVKAVKYERLYQALKDILKTEVTTESGIDNAATVSVIKTKARIVIDFVDDLESRSEKK